MPPTAISSATGPQAVTPSTTAPPATNNTATIPRTMNGPGQDKHSGYSKEKEQFQPIPNRDLNAVKKTIKRYEVLNAKRIWPANEFSERGRLYFQLKEDSQSIHVDAKELASETIMTPRQKWIRKKKEERAKAQKAHGGDVHMEDGSAATGSKRKSGRAGDSTSPKKPKTSAPKFPKRKSLQDIEYEEMLVPPFAVDSEELEDDAFPMKDDNGQEYKWRISKKAMKLYETMTEETDKCDSDRQCVYFGNDFSGYGQIEVMENAIKQWHKEYKKVKPKPEELFFKAEGIALWLAGGEIAWRMADDGERVIALAKLISSLFTATYRALDKEHLIHPESPIKNIGLIAAIITKSHEKDYLDQDYIDEIFARCKRGRIEPSFGPIELGEDEIIEEYQTAGPEDIDDPEGNEFDELIEDYIDEHGDGTIGGHHYDITKMSKREKERNSIGGGFGLGMPIFGGLGSDEEIPSDLDDELEFF